MLLQRIGSAGLAQVCVFNSNVISYLYLPPDNVAIEIGDRVMP